jgi:hypothetical protein
MSAAPTVYTSRKSRLVPAEVRAFARENGLTVGSRGRFSPQVVAAFLSAHPALLTQVLDDLGVKRPKSVKGASAKRREALAAEVAPSLR